MWTEIKNNWYVVDKDNNIVEKFRLNGAARSYIQKNRFPGVPLYLVSVVEYHKKESENDTQ